MLTTAAITGAETINADTTLDLFDDDVPRGVDSVDDTGRGIEGDGRVEASNGDDFGNGKVLTVDAHAIISFPVYQTKETGV